MCKSSRSCDTSSSTTGSGTVNMGTIIDGESNQNHTPSSSPTTTTVGPQQQNLRSCNSREHLSTGKADSIKDDDLIRSVKPRRKLGASVLHSSKIRALFFMIIVVGALFYARFIPQRTIDHRDTESSIELSPFMIIIDGGSTGSRLHIFEFVVISEKDDLDRITANDTTKLSTTTIVERRGSFRTISPLSAYITTNYEYMQQNGDVDNLVRHEYYHVNQTDLKINHIVPLLQYIEKIIPNRFVHTTPIYYAATAGMRLLTESQQNLIYDSCIQIVMDYCKEEPIGTMKSRNNECFYLPRNHMQTLSGELEGYYGVLAANYLHGKIDTNLHVVHNRNNETAAETTVGSPPTTVTGATEDPVLSMNDATDGVTANSRKSITGALDMGGSSTQIVFYTAHNGTDSEEDINVCMNNIHGSANAFPKRRKKKQLNERHFFSMSYLSYGVDQFRDRLWNLLIYDYHKSEQFPQQDVSSSILVVNPCSNPGHNVTATINGTAYLLVGSGSVMICKEYMKRIIPHPIHTPIHDIYDESLRSSSGNKVVGGIQHPSIYNESPPQQEQADNSSTQDDSDTQYPDFLAMSLYFFTFDSIRVFTNDPIVNERWPKPTLFELENATSTYCSMNLVKDIYPLYDNDPLKQPHPYTRKGIVQHRCMEAIYMISLLETFGFRSHERHITFAFDVNGSEVEWTLGMALQYYSNNKVITEQDHTCAWDSHGSHTARDQKSNSSQIPPSFVRRIRNYIKQVLVPDTNSNAKSIASNQ